MFTLNASKSCKAIVDIDPYQTKPLLKWFFYTLLRINTNKYE